MKEQAGVFGIRVRVPGAPDETTSRVAGLSPGRDKAAAPRGADAKDRRFPFSAAREEPVAADSLYDIFSLFSTDIGLGS